jgi:hypothetical protein
VEAAVSSKLLGTFFQTSWRYIPEESSLQKSEVKVLEFFQIFTLHTEQCTVSYAPHALKLMLKNLTLKYIETVVFYEHEPDILDQWLSVLLYIWKAPGSSFGLDTGYPGKVLHGFLSPSRQMS